MVKGWSKDRFTLPAFGPNVWSAWQSGALPYPWKCSNGDRHPVPEPKEVPLTPVVLTFLATAMGVLGVASLVADLLLRDRSRMLRRVDEEFRQSQRDSVRRSRLFKDPRQTFAEAEANEETWA